jgi:uncharacterized membrane protein
MASYSTTHQKSARAVAPVNWHRQHVDGLSAGERAADMLRNVMGSWGFVCGFIVFMLIWALANAFQMSWDPYPYILLNLFLSMLAGLQGAILLIAAKRQDAIAAALAQHDYATDIAAKADIEVVLEINRQQLVLINELQAVVQTLTASNRTENQTHRRPPSRGGGSDGNASCIIPAGVPRRLRGD